MPVSVLVGCQWGDEGKGKIVDILSERSHTVARYQGGANAGHTVVVGDETHVLHLLPVGILRPGVVCVLGNGMVIDPVALVEEIAAVRAAGIEPGDRLVVSPSAHLVLDYHRAVEARRERATTRPIGTTLRGIGPAYETKAARCGLRVGDLYRERERGRCLEALHRWALAAGSTEEEIPAPAEVERALAVHGAAIAGFVHDTREVTRRAIDGDEELLLEGAQGTLLDLDHGTYPFVTSSSTTVGGAVCGMGVPPTSITRAIGVTKAYATRVGEGPFPTEFDAAFSASFRPRAGEFGATTGRPRRCGWLDGVLLRYAAELNGLSALVVTKLDVLDGFETIRIASAHETASGAPIDAERVDVASELAGARPVYEELPGWREPTTGRSSWDDLPTNAKRYLERIAAIAGVPIAMVSTGNRRDQIIVCREELLPAVHVAR